MISKETALKDAISSILNEEYQKESEIIHEIQVLYERCQKESCTDFYSSLVFLMTHLAFEEDEAQRHWDNIITRHSELANIMKREVSLRVAVVDYFTTDYKLLRNPIIIELFLYEVTKEKALIDDLTGLYNFRHLRSSIEMELKRSGRYKLNFCVIFIDMDNLKQINDEYGHGEGDEAILKVAEAISENKRAEDVAFRYGGDEFVYLLPMTDRAGAIECVNRLFALTNSGFKKQKYKVTFSAGIAEYPSDGKDVGVLLQSADKALYEAKMKGKNQLIKRWQGLK